MEDKIDDTTLNIITISTTINELINIITRLDLKYKLIIGL